MAKQKLSDRHKRAVRDWLCAGYADEEIVEKLKLEYGIDITRQSVAYYRDKYGEDIAAAEELAYQRALKLPWCRKSHRLRAMGANAEKMHQIMQQVGPKRWPGWLAKEFRDTLDAIRDEIGDVTPEKHELTGKDGGPIEEKQIGVSGDVIKRSLENLLDRTEGEDS